MPEPKSYQQVQFEKSIEKAIQDAKAQLAGGLLQIATHHVIKRADSSPNPEYKKLALTGADRVGQWIWNSYGRHIEQFFFPDLYSKAIHPQHGRLTDDHYFHTDQAARKAADYIWNLHHPPRR